MYLKFCTLCRIYICKNNQLIFLLKNFIHNKRVYILNITWQRKESVQLYINKNFLLYLFINLKDESYMICSVFLLWTTDYYGLFRTEDGPDIILDNLLRFWIELKKFTKTNTKFKREMERHFYYIVYFGFLYIVGY